MSLRISAGADTSRGPGVIDSRTRMTTVMNESTRAAPHYKRFDDTMKWITLPSGEDKPAWAGLFGAVSMLYVFVDPYRRGAPWIEWMWTGLAFAIFLALCTAGLIYWSRRHVILRVSVAMALLAAAFAAYREIGIAYFVLVAGFAPLAVGGSVTRSGAIVTVVVLLIVAEWRLVLAAKHDAVCRGSRSVPGGRRRDVRRTTEDGGQAASQDGGARENCPRSA